MAWAKNVANNLLPLSIEKRDLSIALKEWFYTGNYTDLETPSADCELCDHPDIRFQFEIQNQHTGETLLVGSECITKFNLTGIDEAGRPLDAASTKKKVNKHRRKLIADAQLRKVVSALVKLAAVDDRLQYQFVHRVFA